MHSAICRSQLWLAAASLAWSCRSAGPGRMNGRDALVALCACTCRAMSHRLLVSSKLCASQRACLLCDAFQVVLRALCDQQGVRRPFLNAAERSVGSSKLLAGQASRSVRRASGALLSLHPAESARTGLAETGTRITAPSGLILRSCPLGLRQQRPPAGHSQAACPAVGHSQPACSAAGLRQLSRSAVAGTRGPPPLPASIKRSNASEPPLPPAGRADES